MHTKQRILLEALRLFSRKGYDAVSVEQIADAVGVKAPSLYKHYKSKQDIFDVMHLIVTAAVVLLSIASLTLIACGSLRKRTCPALGTWALIALGLMIAGAVGTAALPYAYFGIPERFSVFACSGFMAVLGLFHRRGWEKMS